MRSEVIARPTRRRDGAFIVATGIGPWFATANPFG